MYLITKTASPKKFTQQGGGRQFPVGDVIKVAKNLSSL